MKLLKNISLPLIASLALFACERDYDAPLLTEPEYTGPSANITISEQQLGHPQGYLYRTPWEDFEKHVSKDGWANPENAKPLVIDDISTINTNPDAYKFKLIQFTGVTFQNEGTGIFAPESGYGEENITDSHGNTLMIRTSNYASFAGNKLPTGKGNVTGILGRFRGTWQLTLRTASDVSDFTGSSEEGGNEGGEQTPSSEKVLFQESFGTPEKSGDYWPYLSDYKGFDNPASMFENTSEEKASVRIASNLTNVWFPSNKDVAIAIKGINAQGNTSATLEYQVGANVYNAGEKQDLNTLKVKCNGQELSIPSKEVTGDAKQGNTPFKMTIENVTVSDNTTLEFYCTTTDNAYGLRLYNVKLYVPGSSTSGNEEGTTIEPTPEN